MTVNRSLIWDYDFAESDLETESFRQWYVARVLTRGSFQDVCDVGLKTIFHYLPALTLPFAIRQFWEWYFSRPEVKQRYEHLDRAPATGFVSPVPSPFVRR